MTVNKSKRRTNRDKEKGNRRFVIKLICVVLAAAAVLTAAYFILSIGTGDEYVVDVGRILKQSVTTGGALG